MKIYTDYTSVEEWRLYEGTAKKLCDYMRSPEAWSDEFVGKSDLQILSEIELNPDMYNDELRSWLYDNYSEPYGDYTGEEGASLDFNDIKFDNNGNIQ